MHIGEILNRTGPTTSLEFFPPKTEAGWNNLFRTITKFEELSPDFVSVTYGAGGSTRDRTLELVKRIKTETTVEPVPHFTCVCHAVEDVHEIMAEYAKLDIGGVMALGGDAIRDGLEECQRDLPHAIDLVNLIQEINRTGTHPSNGFGVGVAGFPEGHPATPNRRLELEYLRNKVDAGADYICTQLFFDNHDFLDFRDRCAAARIHVPIIAGIMPIMSLSNYERIPDLALGSRYPAALMRRMDGAASDGEICSIGVEWAIDQVRDLLENGVHGVHYYTLNKFEPVRDIWRAVS